MTRSTEEWIGKNDDVMPPPRVRTKDLSGECFGQWSVLSRAPDGKGRRSRWFCKCDCGTTREVAAVHLLSGNSKSCGKCCVRKGSDSAVYKHGKRGGLYGVWCNIIQRCENPAAAQYHDYGGRGITVCVRWRSDYLAFISDMGERPTPAHQIDRIDNNRGYEPGNCRWATRSQNMLNTRRNRIVTYRGQQMPLAEACRVSGVNYGTAKWRLENGRSDKDALR